jgi:hypothetical protein
LLKQYNSLDKRAKKDINENFIRKIKENKPNAYQNNQNINLQNILNEHVSPSKTHKVIKKIFPPSMYNKSRSNSRSKSKKGKGENSTKREQKIHNVIIRNKLPPLPEIHAGGKYNSKYAPKYKNSQPFEIRKASIESKNSKIKPINQKGLQRGSEKRKEDLEIQATSATKHSHYSNYRRPKSGKKQRNLSEEGKKYQKPTSLTKYSNKNVRQRTTKDWNRVKPYKNKSKSKSKSSSSKRKNGFHDGALSTSAASNAGRLISSASTSDKRSVKNKKIPSFLIQNQQLPKINEKPAQKFVKTNPPKPVSRSTQSSTAKVKKNSVVKSERSDVSKEQKSSLSSTIQGMKDQSEEIKKLGNIFIESDEKKLQKRNQMQSDLNSQSKMEQSYTEIKSSSNEKSKFSANISNETQVKHSQYGIFEIVILM